MNRRLVFAALAVLLVGVGATAWVLSRDNLGVQADRNREPAVASPTDPPTLGLDVPPRQGVAGSEDRRDQPGTESASVASDPGIPGDAFHPVTLEGLVVDEQGRPVEGASVTAATLLGTAPTIEGWRMKGVRGSRTGADGRFVVHAMEAGDTLLSAEGPGSAHDMSRMLEDVRLNAPAKDLRLVLVRLGSARLRVLRPDGTPFVGSADWVSDGTIGSGAQRETKDGTYELFALGDGEYEFRVTVTGFAPIRRPFRARLGAAVELGDVVLDLGVTLRGRLTDARGEPVPRARVIVDSIPVFTSDGEGAFRMEHVPRGPADLTVVANDFLTHHLHLDTTETAVDVPITLLRGGVVYGILRDAEANPAGSVDLRAVPLDADGEPAAQDVIDTITQDSGYMFWRLPAGLWRIVWRRPAADGAIREEVKLAEWTLVEGRREQIELRLPPR
jgi:hypothetical protein